MKKQLILISTFFIALLLSFQSFSQTDGLPGTTLDFDGIDDYVQIDNSTSLNPIGDFTWEVWVKLDMIGNSESILSKHSNEGGSSRSGYVLEYNPTEGIKGIVGTTSGWVTITGDTWNVDEWHHLAFTYDDSEDELKLYDNGALAGTATLTNPQYNTTQYLWFGGSDNYGTYFSGKIDEVRYWESCRTITEIRENMYLPLTGSEIGLISYWQFNETSGTTTNDFISGNNGTLTNMDDSDWITSTIPFGEGSSETEIISSTGNYNFAETGVYMNVTSISGTDTLVVSKINLAPNTLPTGIDSTYDFQYWVIHSYGGGTISADINYVVSEDIENSYGLYPSKIKLYVRGNTSDAGWTYEKDAVKVNSAANSALFNGISSFKQFIISRENPPALISIPSDQFESVTENFNGIEVDMSVPIFTDLDGDGLLDMLVGEFHGNIHHYEQAAPNSTLFTLVTDSFEGIDVGFKAAPTFTDLDGDGLLDMLVGEHDGNIHHYEQAAPNSTLFTLVTEFFEGIDVGLKSAPTFTDLDGDALLDMLVGEWDGNINHYEQAAPNSTSFTLFTEFFEGIDVGDYSKPTFTDLDGDGLLDMLVGEHDGNINHYEQDAPNSTSFTLITNSFKGIDVGGSSVPTFTDLDGDGLLDMLVGEYDGHIIHYEQQAVSEIDFSSSLTGNYVVKNYYLKAKGLTADLNIEVTSEFKVSLSDSSGYSSSLSISPVNGIVSDTIFVKFSPLEAIQYNGQITHSSTGCETKYITLTGQGESIDKSPGIALEFDGTDDYVNIPHSSIGNPTGSFTIEGWAKLNSIPSTNSDFISKHKSDGGDARSGYVLSYNPTAGLRGIIGTPNGWKIIDGEPWNSDEWHHIALTYNESTSIMTLFDNGVLQGTVQVTNPTFNSMDLRFGSSQFYGNYLPGRMDEVRYWSVALDSTQVREQMHLNLTGIETGLVSYWQFNEGIDATVNDYLSANDGTLNNMNNNDWVNSTIPFGGGYASSQSEAIGILDFSEEGLSMNYSSSGVAELTVSRIDTTANLTPSGTDTVFETQYWVVHRYGDGTFDTDLTFTISEDLTAEDESDPANISLYTRGSTADTSWALLTSASSVNATNNTATFEGITGFSQFIIAREVDLGIELNLSAFLEGPFNGTEMNGHPELVEGWPMEQPYNISPWNYSGTETLTEIPEDMVDWVLIELRDAADSAAAIQTTQIAMQAALLMSDGSIKTLDGTGNPMFESISVNQNLYAIIWHRNHLPILSANAVESDGGIYTYDFTIAAEQAYGDNQADLGNGYFGMFAADMNADGIINNDDLLLWKQQAGKTGYLMEDANLDAEVENKDKNDLWHQNQREAQVLPE